MAATLSIDWEDFGQLFGKYHHGQVSEPVGGAIERQTQIILDLLDETGRKATFFLLGMLAAYRPQLVRAIAARGHEVALHGMAHTSMFTLDRAAAAADISEARKLIEDQTGQAVRGYRAPFFSIDERNLFVLDVLAEQGFLYDSSLFPMKLPRYGIAGLSTENSLYDLGNGATLVELPLTVARYVGRQLPVSGGGYVRLLPKPEVTRVFRDLARAGVAPMIYMHPYEFDSQPLDVSANYPPGAARDTAKVRLANLRWNLFRETVVGKVRALLTDHQFVTCEEKAVHVKSQGIRTKLLGRA